MTSVKDLDLLIYEYSPASAMELPLEEQVAVVKRLTGVTVSSAEVTDILFELDDLDWRSLVRRHYPDLTQWVMDQLEVSEVIREDILLLLRDGDWARLYGVREAAPFLRGEGIAPVFLVEEHKEDAEQWNLLSDQELEEEIKERLDISLLRKGDLIKVDGRGYDLAIFDGWRLIRLPPYASLPSSVVINDFTSTHYFIKPLPTQARVWVDPMGLELVEEETVEVGRGQFRLVAEDQRGDIFHLYTRNIEKFKQLWAKGEVFQMEVMGFEYGRDEESEDAEISLFEVGEEEIERDWIYEPTDEQLRGGGWEEEDDE